MTPIVRYRCHGCVVSGASNKPPAISATPSSITARGPKRSIMRRSRADGAGNQKAEREGPRGDAAFPSELIDDGWKEQRKRRAGIDADRHGDERHDDDDPAVKKRKPHWVILSFRVWSLGPPRMTPSIIFYSGRVQDVAEWLTAVWQYRSWPQHGNAP